MTPFDDFLASLERELRWLPRRRRRDVVREVRDHLLDAFAAESMSSDAPERETEARVLSRFGDPRLVGSSLASVHRRTVLLAAVSLMCMAALVSGLVLLRAGSREQTSAIRAPGAIMTVAAGRIALRELSDPARAAIGLRESDIESLRAIAVMPDEAGGLRGATLLYTETAGGGYCAVFMQGVTCATDPLSISNPITYSLEGAGESTLLAGMLVDEATEALVDCGEGEEYDAVTSGRYAIVTIDRPYSSVSRVCTLDVRLPSGATVSHPL